MERGTTVLLVEDSTVVRELTADILRKHGYEVNVTATGEKALALLQSGFLPDLILMDIELPGGSDGIETARRITDQWDIPVVFFSSHTDEETIRKIKEVKAYGFIQKGANQELMLSIIEMALRIKKESSWTRMFQRLFESVSVELYLFDAQTIQFTEVNEAARKNLGYTREELRKMTPLDIKPEFQPEKFRQLIDRLLSGERKRITFETLHRRKDGSFYPVRVELHLFDYQGKHHCLAIVNDLTSIKELERTLQEEIKTCLLEYANLADNAPVGIMRCDVQGNILYVNQRVIEILGSPGIEATKRVNLLSFSRLRQHGISQKLEECLREKKEQNFEIEYESLWGKRVWMHVIATPIVEKETVTGAHIIIDDVTERKKMEAELQKKNEMMQLFIEGIPSPAWLVTKERKVLMQNKAAETIFGTRVGEYCWHTIHRGRTVDEEKYKSFLATGIPPENIRCFFCRGDEALERKTKIHELVEYNGFWESYWVPVGDEVYLHYAIDVTRYKEMERQLEELAITDSLLGIYNRRYVLEQLEKEIERSKRSNSPFSLVMFDFDHFKAVNDRFGHDVGDLVLKTIAQLVQKRIRKIDVFGRFGGEEFLIILPMTGLLNALQLAEELRSRIAETCIEDVGTVTASFGVTEYLPGDTVVTMIKRVDKLLYRAKAEGRNCVRYCK